MDLDDVKQILALVREHDLAEFELERDGLKVRVRKAGREVAIAPPQTPAAPAAASPPLPGSGPASGGARGIPRAERVFVNRDLKLSGVDWVGFDMDYTLAIYRQEEMDALSVELMVDRMIKRGYPAYLKKLRFDTRNTPVEKVLSHLTGAGSVVDITISDPPLEEVIAKIYQTQSSR